MNILKLTIKKKYFDEIKAEDKKIEYRWYKPYWCARIERRHIDAVEFRNGRRKDSPKMLVQCKEIKVINGSSPLGTGKQYAIILGAILAL